MSTIPKNPKMIQLAGMDPLILRSARNVLEPGYSTGNRRIEHYQLQYIYEGRGRIEINGKPYEVAKGMLCFWGPAEVHKIDSSEEEPLIILGVQFHLISSMQQVKFYDFEGFPPVFQIPSPTRVEQLLQEIVTEFSAQRLYWQETVSSLCNVLLLGIARQVSASDQQHDSAWEITESVLKFIQDHYNEPLTNQVIAKQFNFHPAYMNKLVVQSTGFSLHQYLVHLRLNKAVELLYSTSMNVGESAEAVGYRNIHYFSKLFKKKMGYSPSRIKKDMGRHDD